MSAHLVKLYLSRVCARVVPVAAFIAATTGSVWLFSHLESSKVSPSNRSTSRAPTSASSTSLSEDPVLGSSVSLLFKPVEGRRLIYRFDRKIALHGLSKQTSHLDYDGELEIDVLHTTSEGVEALARAQLVQHPVKDPVSIKMRISPSGCKMELFTAPTAKGLSAAQIEEQEQSISILKDLLSQWDFALNVDTVGTYQARFEATESAAPLKKIKLGYIQALAPAPDKSEIALPKITASEHWLEWDTERALPREVHGHESTQLGDESQGMAADSEYHLALEREEALSSLVASTAARFTESGAMEIQASQSLSANTLPVMEWADVVNELRGLDQLDSKAQLKVLGDLVRLLKSKPGSIADLQDLLHSTNAIAQGLDSALFKTALGALASVGSPEAQSAVLKVYSDPSCPTSAKGALLSALTTTQAPLTASTQEFLAQAMKTESDPGLSQAASYALGSALSKPTDEEHAASGISAIRNEWSQASSETQKLSVLDAMGNSGQAAYLPEIQSVLGDSSSSLTLRAKAIFALRSINDPQATQILAQSLADPAWQVRQASVQAMSYAAWNEAFRKPLQNCAASDSIANIQSSCRSVLQKSDPTLASN